MRAKLAVPVAAAAAILCLVTQPPPQTTTLPASQTRARPSERRRRRRQATGTRLAGGRRRALRRRVPPRPAPRRNPLPRWPPDIPRRRCRRRPPPHPHPGSAAARSVLLHRRDAPALPGREGRAAAAGIQGHRDPAEDGSVASVSGGVHRGERGDVQGRGGEQRGGVRAVRRRGARVAAPRRHVAGIRRPLPRRHRLPPRRDPNHQIARLLELPQCRRPASWRGACELDDYVLLRVHAVLGEPSEMAQGAAGGGRRRRRGGRSVTNSEQDHTTTGVHALLSCWTSVYLIT